MKTRLVLRQLSKQAAVHSGNFGEGLLDFLCPLKLGY